MRPLAWLLLLPVRPLSTAGSAGGSLEGFAVRDFLCGVFSRAASARQRRRRCCGMLSPGFYLAPVALFSGVGGGVVEFCAGGRDWRFFALAR